MMYEDKLLDLCKKLKPVIGGKADALWLAYSTSENSDMKQEAASYIQLFAVKYLSKEVDSKDIYLPPPAKAQAAGEFTLGDVFYGPQNLYPIGLRRENFRKHIGIFGITGSGKTVVAQNILLG